MSFILESFNSLLVRATYAVLNCHGYFKIPSHLSIFNNQKK